jgi:hypothetical protein
MVYDQNYHNCSTLIILLYYIGGCFYYTVLIITIFLNLGDFQAFLSLFYLCSSNINALINYVGFATWVTSNH